MPIKVEIFTSEPPCSGGRLLLKLVEKIKEEYKDRIEIEIYRGVNPKLSEYGINASPAVVIDKDIRIIGVCPSEETLKEALREAGFKIAKSIVLARDIDMKKVALHTDIGKGLGVEKYISQEDIRKAKELIIKAIMEK